MTSAATLSSVAHLSNAELLSATARLARFERTATVQLIAAMAEVDERRLFLGEGYGSMFTYCTRALRLSEYAAYRRIGAARLARRFPVVLELLDDGSLTLTTVCLLRPYLTHENHAAMLDAARYKNKREVELQLAASMMLRRDVPSEGATASPATANSADPNGVPDGAAAVPADDPAALFTSLAVDPSPAEITPLSADRFAVHLTISKETHDKLRRLQELMRHQVPTGDVVEIMDKALTLLLEQVERQKLGAARRPRPQAAPAGGRRHVPRAVRRDVWARDGGRCAFVGHEGRCEERAFLEYHHIQPYAAGGPTTAANLELRCRPHNQYEADSVSLGSAPVTEGHAVTVSADSETRVVDELLKLGPEQVGEASPVPAPVSADVSLTGGESGGREPDGAACAETRAAPTEEQ